MLQEPALTGDNLGHKTWAASYLLVKRLPRLAHLLPFLSLATINNQAQAQAPGPSSVLELGAGTGVVGLAFVALFPSLVTLTDLPAITPSLSTNAHSNASTTLKSWQYRHDL